MKAIAATIVAATALLLPVVTANIAGAAERTQASATITFDTAGQPEREWVADGVYHLRRRPNSGTVSGGASGTVSNILNVNLDLSSGQGDLFGTYVMAISGKTWKGTLTGSIERYASSGTFVGRSDDGRTQRGTFDEVPGSGGSSFHLTWIELDPHG